MAALATAFVRVRADTSRVKPDVEKAFDGLGRQTGEKFGEDFARGAGSKIRSSRADFVRSGESLGDSAGTGMGRAFSKAFSRGSSTFASVAKVMASRTTILTSGLVAATAAGGKFVAAIAPATGILAGLVPAGAAAAAVTTTLSVALSGVSDAIGKGLYGSATAYGNALEDLSPTQAAVTKQIVAMKERIQETREQVASRFFAPLLDDIEPLAATYLPLAGQEMGFLASAMGGVANEVAEVARSSTAIETVRAVFAETTGAVGGMRDEVGPLTTALLNLLRSSLPIIRQLATGTEGLVERFTAWANEAARTGKMVTWFNSARVTLGELWAIFKNLAAITRAVFTPLIGDSDTLLARLVALTTQAREFVESARGGQEIKNLFTTLGVAGQALRDGLAGVLPEIGESLKIAAPAAAALAQALSRVLVALGPLLPALTQSAAVIATAFVPVLNTLAGLLEENQELLKVIAPFIVAYGVAQKVAAVYTGAAAVAERAWSVAKKISNSDTIVGLRLKALDFAAWVRSTAATVADTTAKVANRVATVAHTVAMGIATTAQKAWAIATAISTKAMNAAGVALRFMTGPIGIAITAIAAITAAIVYLYRNNETFRKIVDRVWAFVRETIENAWGRIKIVFALLATFLTVTLPNGWRRLHEAVIETWNRIGTHIRNQWNNIRTIFNVIRTFVTVTLPNAFARMRDNIANRWNAVGTVISNGWNTIRGYLNSLRNFITQILPNAFSSGVEAIRRAWDRVRQAARTPVSFVVNSVINPLINGWNKIAGVFGAPKAQPIGGFAEGGRIPGPASSRDNRLAALQDRSGRMMGRLAVATGEYVVNAQSTSKWLPFLEAINTKGRRGLKGVDPMKDGAPVAAYAEGGLIGWAKGLAGKAASAADNLFDTIANPSGTLKRLADSALSRIPGGGFIKGLLASAGSRLVSAVIGKIKDVFSFGGGTGGGFGPWPSSPGAQRGDSGVWRKIVAMIKASGINQGSFGNGYRPGDPKWHGSGRAVDWMGYNMDALATWLAARRPLELIHRTRNRDYAYTRGVNKGSFSEGLMNAHRNHIHIAMKKGGRVLDALRGAISGGRGLLHSLPVRLFDNGGAWPSGTLGANLSGRTEYVHTGRGGGGGGDTYVFNIYGPVSNEKAAEDMLVDAARRARRKRRIR